jgi:hypothetical protein
MITCDFEQEDESSSAVLAGEGFCFGELGKRFTRGPEKKSNAQTGLFGGGTQEPAVTNAHESFGENMEEPASTERSEMDRSEATCPEGVRPGGSIK